MIKKMITTFRNRDDLIFLAVGLAAAFVLRLLLRGFVTGDAVTGFIPWYEYIESQGGIPALGHAFSGYPPLYLYMLTTAYYLNHYVLHLSNLVAIKLVAIPFDFFAAYWFGKIVHLKYPNKTVAVLSMVLFLLLPTVFINSAMWGQIDGIFTSFMLAAFYFLLRKKEFWAMTMFGLALSIKFQAIFIAPFLLILILRRNLSLRSLFIPIFIYILTLLPAWALGRPIDELLLLYYNQVGAFSDLSLNAPTFYALVDPTVNYLFNSAGVLVAFMLVLAVVYALYKLNPPLDDGLLINLAAVCLLFVPYILPKMHERYFYPAEVFFLLAAFYRPRLAFVPVILQIAALATYNNYLFGRTFLSLSTDSLLMLAVLVYCMYDLAQQVMLRRRNGTLPAFQ